MNEKLSKLVVYSAIYAHSHAEKCQILSDFKHKRFVPVKFVEEMNNWTQDMDALERLFEEDIKTGLIPCFAIGVTGATNCTGCDDLSRFGDLCRKYGVVSFVDAAYSGVFTALPEFAHIIEGNEKIDFITTNFSKQGLTTMDGTFFAFQSRSLLAKALLIENHSEDDETK